MNKVDYVIVTDSTSDLPIKLIEELGLVVIPLAFEIGGANYLDYPDGRGLDSHEFYEKLRSGEKSVTTMINTITYKEYLEPIIRAGSDILYIAFSSGLSGTYNASLLVADELMELYPGCKIRCVDSRAACLGEGLLAYSAARKKQEGLDLEELYEWIINNRNHLCQWFTVEDLDHLRRGGRINPMTAVVGTALDIKPILHVDVEGHLMPVSRVRGRKKSLGALVEHMVETCTNPQEQIIFIGHGDSLADAELLERLIREKLPVRDVQIGNIGPVIGSHSGPGTIALFFFGREK